MRPTTEETVLYIIQRLLEAIRARSYRAAYPYAWQLCALIFYAAKAEGLKP